MLDSTETIIDTKLIRPSRRRKADMTASLVIPNPDGKPDWQQYFAVWEQPKDGCFKGRDKDDNSIVVMTREAVDAITGYQGDDNKKRPDLFIYIEVTEDGETFLDEVLVAWKGKKTGIFKTQNEEGHDIVIHTREAKEATFKNRPRKRMAAINFDAVSVLEEPAPADADIDAAEESAET
ncbi:hypothetical protein EYS14_00065 [Alteromonadaceae bacterium M269]|nr:hypothetical protein EYS14_00065 [Alteromonadaceae bacterium M269]